MGVDLQSEIRNPKSAIQMTRRESLRFLATMPVAAGLPWSAGDVLHAQAQRAAAGAAPGPVFFTEREIQTVGVLADLILPADDRSGSATDAGVPTFIDFIVNDLPELQVPMRGGLAWLDAESRRRYGHPFADATDADRRALLDDIAWPEAAPPVLRHGVAFFTLFRNLTASGFWSSELGVKDLQYLGNTFVHEWNGAPQEVLDHLGLRYDE